MPPMISSAQAQTTPALVPVATTPVTPIPTTAQVPVVQMMMAPKSEWYEGSGVLTALTALIAVVIGYLSLQRSTGKQIKAGEARAKESLDHAVKQAQTDRLMTARRVNYEDLVDNFVRTQTMFSTMIFVPHASVDFGQELKEFGSPVNKTWLLSEDATAVSARDLLALLEKNWAELKPKAILIQDQMQILEHQRAIRDKERSKKRELEEAGLFMPHTKEAHLVADGCAHEASTAVTELKAIIEKETVDFKNKLFSLQPEIEEVFNALMYRARQELGMAAEEAIELRLQSDKRSRAAWENLKRIHKELTTKEVPKASPPTPSATQAK